MGRFIQPDTVLDGLNRYTYCGNNPVRYTDPTGHDANDFYSQLGKGGDTTKDAYKNAVQGSGNSGDSGNSNTSNNKGHLNPDGTWSGDRASWDRFQSRLADYLKDHSPLSEAMGLGLLGNGFVDDRLADIIDNIPEEFRDYLAPFLKDACKGMQGFGSGIILGGLIPPGNPTTPPPQETPGSYLAGKAPTQVTPGTKSLGGQYVNDLGRVEPWKAYYDEYGRLVGRTDFNAGNRTQGIPDTHYHTYEWGPGKTPLETGSHIPGEYTP